MFHISQHNLLILAATSSSYVQDAPLRPDEYEESVEDGGTYYGHGNDSKFDPSENMATMGVFSFPKYLYKKL